MKKVCHEKRREEIACAAAEIIAYQGMKALTVRSLASSMNCSVGVLAHYYESKDQICSGALDWSLTRIANRFVIIMNSGEISLEKFESLIVSVLPLDERSDLECRVRVQFIAQALHDSNYKELQKKQLALGYQWAIEALTELQREGQIDSVIDITILATLILDWVFGLVNNLLFIPLSERYIKLSDISDQLRKLSGSEPRLLAAI